jgi:hypothetical protein
MDKEERERRFDGILFSLAEQHPQGVLDVSFIFCLSLFYRLNIFSSLTTAAANDRWLFSSQNWLLYWGWRRRMGKCKLTAFIEITTRLRMTESSGSF